MLLWNLDLLLRDPVFFLFLLGTISLSLLVAITFHEFSHALMADRLGDATAKRLGRLSLNPLVHLDPVGTLMLFLVGFGWGKPVPINPYSLRRGERAGMALVGLAGPLSNLIVAGAFALPIRMGMLKWHSPFVYRQPFMLSEPTYILADLLGWIIFYNILLAVFNLIPLPPLDGFRVAVGILPRELSYSFSKIERYGPMILILVIAFSYFTNLDILWRFLTPVMDFFSALLVGRSF